MKIFSFDAETNGLWGEAFSIAAVVMEDGIVAKTFLGRCPIDGEINPWVAKNVLPKMKNIKTNSRSYMDMLKSFSEFYLENKEDAHVIVHVGFPVETKILHGMQRFGFIRDWDAPFPLVDISAIPEIGTSVDNYNKERNLEVLCSSGCHNPLYDATAAAVAYEHWKGKYIDRIAKERWDSIKF